MGWLQISVPGIPYGTNWSPSPPAPSCPNPWSPQQWSCAPVVATAHECKRPEARVLNDPATSCGVVGDIVRGPPIPIWPSLLEPQHQTSSLVVRPQVWSPPGLTVSQLCSATAVGTKRSAVSPTPSCPSELRPQHR